MTDTPQEIMARGICESQGGDMDTLNPKDIARVIYTEAAKAAISALKEAGYVICPIEPTEAMVDGTAKAIAEQHVGEPGIEKWWYYRKEARAAIQYLMVPTPSIQASTHED